MYHLSRGWAVKTTWCVLGSSPGHVFCGIEQDTLLSFICPSNGTLSFRSRVLYRIGSAHRTITSNQLIVEEFTPVFLVHTYQAHFITYFLRLTRCIMWHPSFHYKKYIIMITKYIDINYPALGFLHVLHKKDAELHNYVGFPSRVPNYGHIFIWLNANETVSSFRLLITHLTIQ